MEIIVLAVIAGCLYWLYKNRGKAPAKQKNEWVRRFSVHYITESLCLHASSEGDVPERVIGLMDDNIQGGTQQTFIASLAAFLRDEYRRDFQRGDYQLALADLRNVLATQTARANSNNELRRLISAMHKEEEGTEITLKELDEAYNKIMTDVRSDRETAAWVMGRMLRFNMETMFKEMFGVSYGDYLKAKYPKDAPVPTSAAIQT